MIGPALPALEIGGVIVPLWAAAEMTQQYVVIGARPIIRLADGSGIMQARWARLKTTISGAGWLPAGLDGLDVKALQTLKCAAARTIESTSPSITLPSARRADYTPGMTALMPGRVLVETPSTLVGNVLTGSAVAGASAYLAWYWPQLTGYISSLTTGDHQGSERPWQIEFEEA